MDHVYPMMIRNMNDTINLIKENRIGRVMSEHMSLNAFAAAWTTFLANIIVLHLHMINNRYRTVITAKTIVII